MLYKMVHVPNIQVALCAIKIQTLGLDAWHVQMDAHHQLNASYLQQELNAQQK